MAEAGDRGDGETGSQRDCVMMQEVSQAPAISATGRTKSAGGSASPSPLFSVPRPQARNYHPGLVSSQL